MQDIAYQSTDAATSSWLDAGSASSSGTLYGSKDGPPPPPPPPPPPEDPSVIRGTDGDDTLQGTTGDNTIYGGKGQDTVVYRGTLGDYELSFDSNAWAYRLTDKISGRDGSDLLNGVERVQFDGITLLLGHDGSAHLEDGTEVLAPYVFPPPPILPDGGYGDYIGLLPGEYSGGVAIAVEDAGGTPAMAHWVGCTGDSDVALNGVTTLAVDLPFAGA
jgi:Ca2+-binding RTX toxin-like protein